MVCGVVGKVEKSKNRLISCDNLSYFILEYSKVEYLILERFIAIRRLDGRLLSLSLLQVMKLSAILFLPLNVFLIFHNRQQSRSWDIYTPYIIV